jgi:hypothetical protein
MQTSVIIVLVLVLFTLCVFGTIFASRRFNLREKFSVKFGFGG